MTDNPRLVDQGTASTSGHALPSVDPEALLRRALDASGIASWSWDAAHDVTWWDQRFAISYDLPADASPSIHTWLAQVRPDDRGRLLARLERMRSTPGDDRWAEEFRSVSPGGGERWHQSIGRAHRDGDGHLTHMAGIDLEITARKRKDAALEILADINRDLADLNHIPVTMSRLAGKIGAFFGVKHCMFSEQAVAGDATEMPYAWRAGGVAEEEASEGMQALLSAECRQALSQGQPVVVADAEADRRIDAQTAARHGIRAVLVTPVTRDGVWRFATCLCTDTPREWPADDIALLQEVTARTWARLERARTDELLRESEGRQRFLLALSDALRPISAPDAIKERACALLAERLDVERAYYVELDEDAGIARVARDVVRRGASSLAGEHRIKDFGWSVAILRRGECHAVTDTRTSPVVPDEERAAAVALQIIACMGAPLIKGGHLVGALCVTDSRPRAWTPAEVTLLQEVGERIWEAVERGRAEEALRTRSEALERQTTQLRRLASELTLAEQSTRENLSKTLHDHLQQLLFSASLCLERALMSPQRKALLQATRAELQDAMDAARSLSVDLFPPALRTQGLPGGLEWLPTWARSRYDLELAVHVDPEADPEEEDARILLFESVRELVFNAAKHAQATRVDVRLSRSPDGAITIEVVDDGQGFDPRQVLDQAVGHGLGLFTIRERLALLGGQFVIDSAPGHGARFTLTLPRHSAGLHSSAPDAATEPSSDPDGPPAPADAPSPSSPLRILLADDHVMVREGLRKVLGEFEQFQVVGEAADGAEAVRLAHALQPDVVVMDVAMPVLDGVEATRRLRAELPHVRVLGLSTQAPDVRHPIQDAGAAAYFSKGNGAIELVAGLLAEHRARFQGVAGDGSAAP